MTETRNIPLSEFHTRMTRANLPFVSYRMPGTELPETIFGPDTFAELENIEAAMEQERGFVVAPYEKGEPLLWLPAKYSCVGFEIPAEYSKYVAGVPAPPEPLGMHTPGKSEYQELVSKAIDYIRAGRAGKVVLSRRLVKKWPEVHNRAGDIFGWLCRQYPRAFVYLAHIPGKGLWTGASPEILLTGQDELFSTMSLSGTRKRLDADDGWGQKEIDEHMWVSRFIGESLVATGCTELEISPMHTAIAGGVEHLRTRFSGRCPPEKMAHLIDALHPTPAVCGWPAPVAREIIRELENYDRSLYTGYLGPVRGTSGFSLFVNLRCMHLQGDRAVIYVGGGITIDSDPLTEWEETVLKSRTMLSAIENLGNFAG